MTVTLTMPRLGETMEEGTVSAWLIEEGAAFKRGEALVEFETDKTAVEYPALGPGRLARVLAQPGDVVKLGEPIAEIDLDGAADWVTQKAGGEDQGAGDSAEGDDRVMVDLPMPRLGETMEEGKIGAWEIAEGADFARGAPLLEIETDKTAAEFPALVAGRLVEILASPGDVVAVGRPIARIAVARADAAAFEVNEDAAPEAEDPAPGAPARRADAAGSVQGNPRATPVARRLARRGGIALNTIAGSGRRGRIEAEDVRAALAGGSRADALAETCWGPAEGAKVLLLHGFSGDRLTVDRLGQGFGRAGLSARAVDLPGHGESDAEAQGFDDLVDAVAAELSRARGTHVVAHSLGAAAAARAAARSGGALSLTLIAPAGIGPAIDGDFVARMAAPASAGETAHLMRRLSTKANGLSEDMIAAVHATLSKGRLRALAADIAAGDRQKIDVVGDLARLAEEIPVRILVGHRDAILDWHDALAISPRIAVHHFAEAGHMPHWDAPETVRDLIIGGFNV